MRRNEHIHSSPEHSGEDIGRSRQLVANLVEQANDGARVRIGRKSALAGWNKKVIDNIIRSGHGAGKG